MTTSELNKGVKVEFIHQMLLDGVKFTNRTKDKDLVLVLGNTGVGKSTLCNYLAGYRMKKITHNYLPAVDTELQTNYTIGHEISSETLYAKPLVVRLFGRAPICLLDCPGFSGNRIAEETIIEKISTELAIRKANQIQRILILISIQSLMDTRVSEIRKLLKTLIALFVYPLEMARHAVFVITKVDCMQVDDGLGLALNRLRGLKDHCLSLSEQLKHSNLNSTESLTVADYDNIASFLSVIVEMENVICCNPVNDGESRNAILLKILFSPMKFCGVSRKTKEKKISVQDFNFYKGDKHRLLFDASLCHLATDLGKPIDNFYISKMTVDDTTLELFRFVLRLSELHDSHTAIKKDIDSMSDESSDLSLKFSHAIQRLHDTIYTNKKWIGQKDYSLQETCGAIEEADNYLRRIDTTEPFLILEKSICKKVDWYKMFGWEKLDFSMDTMDTSVPLVSVEKDMVNGAWIEEKDERHVGRYSVTYVSNYYANPAEASVRAYIETNKEPGNKAKIQKLKESLEKLSHKQNALKEEIENIKAINATLENNIEKARNESKDLMDALKRESKNCEIDKEFYHCQANIMHQIIKGAKCSGLECLKQISEKKDTYDILTYIDSLLQFKSSLIRDTVSAYNDLLSRFQSYQALFNEDNGESLQEWVHNQKDRTTGENIRDLAITKAGTPFDLLSLISQFDEESDGNQVPYVYVNGDGASEEIGYFSWNTIDKEKLKLIDFKFSSPDALSISEIDGVQQKLKDRYRGHLIAHSQKIAASANDLSTQNSSLNTGNNTNLGFDFQRIVDIFSSEPNFKDMLILFYLVYLAYLYVFHGGLVLLSVATISFLLYVFWKE